MPRYERSDPIWGGILLLNLALCGAVIVMMMYYEKWGIIAPVPVVWVALFMLAYCYLGTLPLSWLNEHWKTKRRERRG